MKSRIGTLSATLVAFHDPLSPAAEAFRAVRTNLQFLGLDRPLKSVLITSAGPGEGKSTSAANLAIAFAQTGATVCLLDADLRRPTVHQLFGLHNWEGLTTMLIGTGAGAGAGAADLTPQPTKVPGLSVIVSGPIPPNPAELLGSRRMEALLADLEQRFDMVIIDAPPVLPVTDSMVLAPKVGGVMLVARSGAVNRQQLARAQQLLDGVKANVLGSVLTAHQATAGEDAYQYYYAEGEPARKRGFWSRLRRRFRGERRPRAAAWAQIVDHGGDD